MSIYHDEVEIEDMEYDDDSQTYYYPCPCGDRFMITKEELSSGEDVATCPSCSLIIKVIYDAGSVSCREEGEENARSTQSTNLLELILAAKKHELMSSPDVISWLQTSQDTVRRDKLDTTQTSPDTPHTSHPAAKRRYRSMSADTVPPAWEPVQVVPPRKRARPKLDEGPDDEVTSEEARAETSGLARIHSQPAITGSEPWIWSVGESAFSTVTKSSS